MYMSLCMHVFNKTLCHIDVGRKEINLYYRLPVLQINITGSILWTFVLG